MQEHLILAKQVPVLLQELECLLRSAIQKTEYILGGEQISCYLGKCFNGVTVLLFMCEKGVKASIESLLKSMQSTIVPTCSQPG